MDVTGKRSLKVTWSRALGIWWSYVWRCVVISLFAGSVLGFAGNFIAVAMGRNDLAGTAGALLGYSVFIPVSIITLKRILQMRFKEFSLHLISHNDSSEPIRELLELRKEKENLGNILSNISPDVLLVVSPDRTIKMCNNSVERMFGYEMDEVIGRKTDLLYFDRRFNPEHRGEIYEILEREGYHIGLAKGKKKNNEIIPLEIITGKLTNRSGAVLLLRDISERKRT